ncbi:MAG: anti-sigma factor [Nostoc sp. NMS1]|uniref:anti-sigma factor domain-containing protein n=1 Tax=unclassified Nostoc TaxID=2593658 RepID=UPI0025F963B1|nr:MULTISPECIES: anti-sigma factor [unclassified Nostoc]MBN3910842.1 anti-sigma factor [Nostoc sp. NMS1]MBN3994687.1 anti-sigma factor [Nostoc sp. NMS2]
MTAPENSQYVQQLAAGYIVGELAPNEALEFQQMLAENPSLAVEVEQLQQVLDEVVYGLNAVEPPPHLRAAILSNLLDVETENLSVSHRRPVRAFPYSLSWRKIIGSVAALLILYLGIDNYHLRTELQVADNLKTLLQQKATRLFPLRGVNVAETASGSFVLNLEQQTGVIAVQNVPPPPVGSIYRLWAVVEGEKIPCGQLRASTQGKIVEKFAMPADFYDAGVSEMFVTLETSTDYRYPLGPVIMKSSFTFGDRNKG